MLTGRMPVDWFPPESWPLLTQLCRHICQSRWFGECLQEVRAGCLGSQPNDEALVKIDTLSRLHAREGVAIQSLMVKLRLTTQARMPSPRDAEQVRSEIADVRPWLSS